jgi:hypothetical protein
MGELGAVDQRGGTPFETPAQKLNRQGISRTPRVHLHYLPQPAGGFSYLAALYLPILV